MCPLLRQRITRTSKRVAHVLQVLTLRDEDGQEQTIRVTEEHPFYVDSQGWTAARKLCQGDILLAAEGTLAVVSNHREAHPQGVTVYNLEVEQAHTYFVLAEDATDAVAVWVHNTCKRPGGYETGDVDVHGNLSPSANRAPGFTNTAADGRVQSHHFIQDAWAELNISGYTRNAAPGSLLRSSAGEPHAIINGLQAARRNASGWAGSLRSEFNAAYADMISAGVEQSVARRAAKQAYKYFDSIGGFR